jgi:hypothetical protein
MNDLYSVIQDNNVISNVDTSTLQRVSDTVYNVVSNYNYLINSSRK